MFSDVFSTVSTVQSSSRLVERMWEDDCHTALWPPASVDLRRFYQFLTHLSPLELLLMASFESKVSKSLLWSHSRSTEWTLWKEWKQCETMWNNVKQCETMWNHHDNWTLVSGYSQQIRLRICDFWKFLEVSGSFTWAAGSSTCGKMELSAPFT